MAGTVDSIHREITALQEATAALADELNAIYQEYLQAFGKATRQQLILASYHLCTQDYPDAFLRLSVGDRRRLQQSLRDLGSEAQARLQRLLEPTNSGETAAELAAHFADPPVAQAEASASPEMAAPDLGPPVENSHQVYGQLEAESGESGFLMELALPNMTPVIVVSDSEANFGADSGADSGSGGEDSEEEAPLMKALLMNAVIEAIEASRLEEEDAILTPTALARRHMLLERQLRNLLQGVSKAANHLLQQAQVAPHLPDGILAAAAIAQPMTKAPSAPNLLNMLIDVDEDLDDDDDDDDDGDDQTGEDGMQEGDQPRTMAHVVVMNLRLADIEFADPQASLWRGKLRAVLARLKKLGKRYQQKLREQAIAEAELAWRSVWYDDASNSN